MSDSNTISSTMVSVLSMSIMSRPSNCSNGPLTIVTRSISFMRITVMCV